MPSPKHKSTKSKKEKSKLAKLIESDPDDEENIHELSFYINDRVKLMKEVLKIIKPKQVKRMAPDCIKDMDIEEINSMLLEELLGISNKRLKYIFNGENLNEDTSSSTDPEEEKPIDIISLDDVSDDDFVIDLDSDSSRKHKKIKKEKDQKSKKVKKEKNKDEKKEPLEQENLMNVLELLELQARARAIKSQLALEANKKKNDQVELVKNGDDDEEDAVIIESPKNEEIVITSDSENEQKEKESKEAEPKKNKIKLIRDRYTQPSISTEHPETENNITSTNEKNSEDLTNKDINCEEGEVISDNDTEKEKEKHDGNDVNEIIIDDDDDGIIINVDHEEMAGIE